MRAPTPEGIAPDGGAINRSPAARRGKRAASPGWCRPVAADPAAAAGAERKAPSALAEVDVDDVGQLGAIARRGWVARHPLEAGAVQPGPGQRILHHLQ